jgi:LysR family cys regulon transcriptional activator
MPMRLRQLQYIREIANHHLSISKAAAALHTTQPGVSKQVRLLEEELGVMIFIRSRSRITEVTEVGQKILEYAHRVLREVNNLKRVCDEHRQEKRGTLTVAASHAHARYKLPILIRSFVVKYPHVSVVVRQGNPSQVWTMVTEGVADLAFATEPKEPMPELTLIKCDETSRVILTPPRHPLLRRRNVVLNDLAKYPIITHDHEHITHSAVIGAFRQLRLEPKLILRAGNSDVMKGYVEAGLGIAIVSKLAFDRKRDRGLRAIDVTHLFGPAVTYLGFRHNDHFRRYILDFMELLGLNLDSASLKGAGLSLPR